MTAKSKKSSQEFVAVGRRKTASARVRLQAGSGKVTVNGKDIAVYFPGEYLQNIALAPLKTINQVENFDMTILVVGGGVTGQSAAVAHGTARALQLMDMSLRPQLKAAGHMKRDPRMKERKKPGQPGARKRFQFSKR